MLRVTLFVIIFCLTACFGRKPASTGLEGKSMPTFNLLLIDSVTYLNTGNIPGGKETVIFGFTPFCPHCRAQLEEMLGDMDSLQHLQFYMVSGFPMPEIQQFMKKYELEKYGNVKVGRDTADVIARYFKAPGAPYTAIYDKDKKLIRYFLGRIKSKDIVAAAQLKP